MTMTTAYDRLPAASPLVVTSEDFLDGEDLAVPQYSRLFGVPGGEDRSPQLAWTGAPATVKSYIVSMYDDGAPTPSGLWHWMIADLPSTTGELAAGLTELPAYSWTVKNDARTRSFVGAAPALGVTDRYTVAVHGLDIASVRELGLGVESTPGFILFTAASHIVALGVITALGRG